MKTKFLMISLYEACPPTFGAGAVTCNLFKNLPNCRLIQTGRSYSEKGRIITIKGGSSRWKKFVHIWRILNEISKIVEKINPDYIIMEGASWSFYYLVLLKMIKMRNTKAKIIYHDHNVEFELRKGKENRFIYMITKYCEKKLLQKSDFCFAVSERDAKILKKISGKNVGVLRNGVDFSFFSKRISKAKLKFNWGKKNIFFMGSYGYKPNKEAIDFMLDEIMPRLPRDFRFIVTGGDVRRRDAYLINPGILKTTQLRAIIKGCDICVAPIFSGSGTRLKILEYLASGKPVVATSKAVEGLNVCPGKDLLIANSPDEFTEKIKILLKNRSLREKISRNGREAAKNYDWKKITKKFLEDLK